MTDFRDVLARQLVEAASASRGRRAARAMRVWAPTAASAAALAAAIAVVMLAGSPARRSEPAAVAPTAATSYVIDVTPAQARRSSSSFVRAGRYVLVLGGRRLGSLASEDMAFRFVVRGDGARVTLYAPAGGAGSVAARDPACDKRGTYRVTEARTGRLRLAPVADACRFRRELLTLGAWRLR